MVSKHTLLTATALAAALLPQAAFGYLSPEDVLLNRELFLPPSAREAQQRTELQEQESAARRDREQQAAYDLQHPAAEEEPVLEDDEGNVMDDDEDVHGAAPDKDDEEMDEEDMELLRSLRLLTRVQDNQDLARLQQQVLYIGGQSLHSGAPLEPLAPTGAGSVLAALVGIGAVIWTLWSVRRANREVHTR